MKKRVADILFLAVLCLLLVALFNLIYQFFRVDWGALLDEKLTKGDWLAFVGSYLGFAGSTLLAIAVFRQDQKINALVSAEYDPILFFHVIKFERLSDEIEGDIPKYVPYSVADSEKWFEQFVYDPIRSSSKQNVKETAFRIYLTIESKGKLPIDALSINKIELDDDKCVYKKDIEKKQLVAEMVQPNGIQYICMMLNQFPRSNDFEVHTLCIHYSANIFGKVHYKSYLKLLLTGNEKTLYDGINYLTQSF